MWLTEEKLTRYKAITNLYKDLWFVFAERVIADRSTEQRNQIKFDYFFRRYFSRKQIIELYKLKAKEGWRPKEEDNK